MEIKGKVYCFFEQSGTFKNEFKKLGYDAEDYDIQNEFSQTDHVTDLFAEIEKAYDNKPSIFDKITPDDLVMAFFPCVYFSAVSQMAFSSGCVNYRKLNDRETAEAILKRSKDREKFYALLIKLFCVTKERGLRMIVENPYSEQTYLKANFTPPTMVDRNRMMRGDYRVKPTAYWFVNSLPTYGQSFQNDKEKRTHMKSRGSKIAGICSTERSMISSDYARNFICDFIIGKEQKGLSEPSFF